MPVGTNVFGAGYGATSGEIFLDPVLRIEDGEVDAHSVLLSYVHAFSVAGKSVRVDALLPWQRSKWQGLLDGQPATATRIGFADPRIRLSVILAGAPAMNTDEFRNFMVSRPVHTVFGAAIAVTVPWGEYQEDKLLNLGQNRFTIRPQIGVVHTRGPWSYELTGSTFFYTENDDFFDGSKLEQDPLFATQAHAIRQFRPGWWASLSAGYAWGGQNDLNDQARDDERADFLWALSFGFPLGRNQGAKIAYLRRETRVSTGIDADNLVLAWSTRF